ncbi:MAG TPA: hypothetical protein HPP87_02040 [Planctomycetes bacterium]|nr:hypothetical protein [Planctomycetota bacterium]HIJ70127.1 hypothetical protein [Planctomycetota bacterium]
MKEKNDIEKRLEDLGRAIAAGDSIADKVMHRLDNSQAHKSESKPKNMVLILRRFGKFAIAAVVLVLAGYAGARFATPAIDTDKLRSALKDSFRSDLVEEMKQLWRADLAASYVQLRDELDQQHQKDLNRFALQTIAASNTATNELLTELIQSISDAQIHERQWILAALDRIEMNRINDKDRLSNGLLNLALQTTDEFKRTRQDMVQLLVDKQGNSLIPEK